MPSETLQTASPIKQSRTITGSRHFYSGLTKIRTRRRSRRQYK
ncbi:hypothetical protein [Neisseria meningitidis]|nr:hypothetical protein [Neisseria meningitidis]